MCEVLNASFAFSVSTFGSYTILSGILKECSISSCGHALQARLYWPNGK